MADFFSATPKSFEIASVESESEAGFRHSDGMFVICKPGPHFHSPARSGLLDRRRSEEALARNAADAGDAFDFDACRRWTATTAHERVKGPIDGEPRFR
jgi:hypothetical protein